MSVPFMNYPQNPINLKKLKKKPKEEISFKSSWAFLTSIVIYITVFYVFNLSPSTLFCTTTFWFFIANTIIIIVAADFGSFSLSKERDLYEEYIKNEHQTRPNMTIPSHEVTESIKISERRVLLFDNDGDIQEIIPPEEKIISMVKLQDHRRPEDIFEEKEQQRALMNVNRKPKRRKARLMKRCERSVSDKAVIEEALEDEDRSKVAFRRTLSERYYHDDQSMLGSLASNEFEIMSDDQLNRRVEEFIRKFNREIRLQAVRSS